MLDRPPRCPGRRRAWLEDAQYETKSKIEAIPDEKAIETGLERKYIVENFYDLGNIFAKVSLGFIGIDLFCAAFVPGARFHASVGALFWLGCYVICKHVVRYKGTEHEMYGKKLSETIFEVSLSVHEILQLSNDSLASEESRNAHNVMIVLTVYAVAGIVFRILIPKYKKSPVWCLSIPLIALRYPRFGVFSPCYEALAFFVAVSLGFAIGGLFDEMRWRYFLLMNAKELEIEKKSKEVLEESRKQEMTMGVLSSFEQARWKA